MTERYPFILPIFITWLIIFFIPIIVVFYTKVGLNNLPILNRKFVLRLVSITLFLFVIIMMFSGLMQLMGSYKVIFEKSTGYWHALIGFLMLLAALNHVVIHVKDIYRYIFKSKPKAN